MTIKLVLKNSNTTPNAKSLELHLLAWAVQGMIQVGGIDVPPDTESFPSVDKAPISILNISIHASSQLMLVIFSHTSSLNGPKGLKRTAENSRYKHQMKKKQNSVNRSVNAIPHKSAVADSPKSVVRSDTRALYVTRQKCNKKNLKIITL